MKCDAIHVVGPANFMSAGLAGYRHHRSLRVLDREARLRAQPGCRMPRLDTEFSHQVWPRYGGKRWWA